MTSNPGTPDWPDAFLRTWPGRFRHAQLVRRLHGGEQTGDDDPSSCLLQGISAGRTVDQVLEEFADQGEFQLVETLLAESPSVSDRARTRLSDLEPRRAERLSQLTTRLRTLTDQALGAGVPFGVDTIDLEARVRVSWPAAEEVLKEHLGRISARIGKLSAELTERNQSLGHDPRLRAAVDSLIGAGRLTLAERVLNDGAADLLVPEAQPRLPSWSWADPAAEVLSWHMDPTRQKPLEFSAWRAADRAAHELVEATERLVGGGLDAAREFATALERFLDHGAPEPPVHEFSAGHLSSVALFRSDPLASFHPTASVSLLILPPGVQNAPTLPGVGNYLAVGPDLRPGGGFRTPAAVLATEDILRLVTLSSDRPIGLARIAGRQWPLSAFGAGNSTGLGRLLAEDATRPWHLLGWLCYLLGVGGSATAQDLEFQAGTDTPVLHTLLTNLADTVTGTAGSGNTRTSTTSVRERGSIGVESVVLRDCPDLPSRAAFWAALVMAPPGTTFTLDSLVIAAVLSPAGEDADWESTLAGGFEQLRSQWFVQDVDASGLMLRPLGVITGLRSLAVRRLAECARELTAPATAEPDEEPRTPVLWSVHRYALSVKWPAYDRARREAGADVTPPDPEALPDELVETAAGLPPGPCDLAQCARSLVAVATACFPDVQIFNEIPDHIFAAVPERAAVTVLYELLENALEATNRAGKIMLSARVEGNDVLLDVLDDGPGLDPAVSRNAQVFRPGFSTRDENRGLGMYLARRITDAVGGELEVASRSQGHPVFKGAHFTLIIPLAS